MIKKILLSFFGVILLLLLFLAYGRKNLILSKATVKAKYTTPISHFLNWKGNEIHYTDDGSGFPVLMIHGFGGSSHDFVYLDSLMNDKFRIIRVDLPGFGLSDFPVLKEKNPDYNKMYTEFFNYFLDTLHLDSMYVVGNSMGGMAAWDMAARQPGKVKKLVLLNSAGYEMHKVIKVATEAFRFAWLEIFFQKGVPRSLVKFSITKCFANDSVITDEKTQLLADLWDREGSLDVFFKLATTTHFLDTTLIKQIQCPTLIMWGKEDKIVPVNHADRFHRDIKNSREVIYSPCGHVPMVERPSDVAKDIIQFFKE